MTDARQPSSVENEEITIQLNGVEVGARPGELIIAAAERAGVYIPRFCYHPRMRSVGMCRMCLVEVKGPRGFALTPACFASVAPGMEILTDSPGVAKAQDGVLEFLLLNHPLDCPVCDKGGECPLQDQTMTYGPGESRFVEEKRHWPKPISISPLVDLDRERCIQCDRCTRFASEIAGDPFINFFGRGDHIEVATFPDRPFASYFSGNTVQICPVGALTASPYRFKARPWDLEQVESTCTTCGVGCRMAVQSSSGRLVRNLGIDVDSVNQGWLCDKGRFSFQAIESPSRRRGPLVRKGESFGEASWQEALRGVAGACSRAASSGGRIAVLGGAHLANEDAYAWARFAKGVLQTDWVDAQLADGLPAELIQGLPRATIDEACSAKAILLVGPDPREELPVLFLRLRSALTSGRTRLVELTPQSTSLSSLAASSLRYLPGEMQSVLRSLLGTRGTAGAELPSAKALEAARVTLGMAPGGAVAGGDGGEGVVVLFGRASLAEPADATAEVVGMIADSMPAARFLHLGRRGNLQGALDAGLAPGMLPGRVSLAAGRERYGSAWEGLPPEKGEDARGIVAAAASGRVDVLFLLGADPLSDFPDRALAKAALERARFVVSIETIRSPSSDHADVVLAASGWAERPGTTTNIEGRVSVVAQKVVPPGTARPDWMIAEELSALLDRPMGFQTLEDIRDEMRRLSPLHRGLGREAFAALAAGDGLVLPLAAAPVTLRPRLVDPMSVPGVGSVDSQGSPSLAGNARAGWDLDSGEEEDASQVKPDTALGDFSWTDRPVADSAPPRDGYSLRLVVSRRLYDAGMAVAESPALAGLAEAVSIRVHPSEIEGLGLHSGDPVAVVCPQGRVTMKALSDASVSKGVALVQFNAVGSSEERVLFGVGRPVHEIRLESR